MDKEQMKLIYMQNAYNASASKFFGVDKNSIHAKELEKSFESFWKQYVEQTQNNNGNTN